MAGAGDDQMIMHCNAHRLGSVHDGAGHLDIVPAGGRISRWVIVHENDGAGLQFQRALHDFARIHWCLVHRSLAHRFIADQDVAVVEKQHPELLCQLVREAGVQIVHHRIEICQHRAGPP